MNAVGSSRSPIKLFWWSPRRDMQLGFKELRRNGRAWLAMNSEHTELLSNFGDELSPAVLQYATGRRVAWAPAQKAEVIAVGSIIEYYARRSSSQAVVWGSGLRDAPSKALVTQIKASVGHFSAVRGPKTAEALGLKNSTSLGDPGVLVPLLGNFGGSKSGVLYLPHFRTWTTSQGRSQIQQAIDLGMRVVPPSTRPIDMINAISRSDLVLSSSLHGVVVAHALGVAVQSLGIPSGGMAEPDFKYEDYFSSINLEYQRINVDTCFNRSNLNAIMEHRSAEVPNALTQTRELAHNLVTAATASLS